MLPQHGALYFLLNICETSAVVVVFPFVPVIAIKGVFVFLYASSISEITGIFFS